AVAHERGARHVVVGHTADDQAETILHRALRGTGVAGLAGMRSSRGLADGVALLRPLLRLSRGAARDFLVAAGEVWREDASNADVRHARNFVRHELLARAALGPYPAAARALGRLGGQAAAAAAALDSAAAFLLDAHAERCGHGGVVLHAAALAACDPLLLGHVLVALWKREGWPRRDMAARHYEAVAALVQAVGRGDGPVGPPFDLPAGVRAVPAPGRRIELVPRSPVRSAAQ
ncbi:MAG: tRNA lysidine(34) synthetase TilS, partial [Planctomycetia bacterium]|nr:tRNA lysidine(34) synthetase TilS [Planctomycetia bacterium]